MLVTIIIIAIALVGLVLYATKKKSLPKNGGNGGSDYPNQKDDPHHIKNA